MQGRSGLELYESRMTTIGTTKRDSKRNNARMSYKRRMVDSLACHKVLIAGEEQWITIRHGDNYYEKKITALPGDTLKHGGYVDYSDSKWIITSIDYDNEIYQRGIMLQCNFLLKWINKSGNIVEKWCYIVDGTKYLIGERSNNLMTIGDSRIAMTIPKDEDTIELTRGRRFLIADVDTDALCAYEISKSNTLFDVFDREGVFRFILNETNVTKNDNKDLMIADCDKWIPRNVLDSPYLGDEMSVAELISAEEAKQSDRLPDGREKWL